jgi:hypothetical protein
MLILASIFLPNSAKLVLRQGEPEISKKSDGMKVLEWRYPAHAHVMAFSSFLSLLHPGHTGLCELRQV